MEAERKTREIRRGKAKKNEHQSRVIGVSSKSEMYNNQEEGPTRPPSSSGTVHCTMASALILSEDRRCRGDHRRSLCYCPLYPLFIDQENPRPALMTLPF